MAINLRGLTRETFALRWETHLTSLDRAVLVREAFEDCERVRPTDIVRFAPKDYDRMFEALAGTGHDWEVLQEVHNRLAGDRRPEGRLPSNYTGSLLLFVPPDQFVSPDDKESV